MSELSLPPQRVRAQQALARAGGWAPSVGEAVEAALFRQYSTVSKLYKLHLRALVRLIKADGEEAARALVAEGAPQGKAVRALIHRSRGDTPSAFEKAAKEAKVAEGGGAAVGEAASVEAYFRALDERRGVGEGAVEAAKEDEGARNARLLDAARLAKRRVASDAQSGPLWKALGLAYAAQFEASGFGMYVPQALAALKNAATAQKAPQARSPDLLWCRSSLQLVAERYDEALADLDAVAEVTESPVEKERAEAQAAAVRAFVADAARLVATRAGMPQKKMAKLATAATTKLTLPGRTQCGVAELKEGKNGDRFVVLSVLATLSRDAFDGPSGAEPFSCVAADADGTVCVVSVYNTLVARGSSYPSGAVLTMAAPALEPLASKACGVGPVLRLYTRSPQTVFVNDTPVFRVAASIGVA